MSFTLTHFLHTASTSPALAYLGGLYFPIMQLSSTHVLLVFLTALGAVLFAKQSGPAGNSVPAAVEISYCGMRPSRPPLKYMSFNVTVSNTADRPQWFLFPAALYDKPGGERKAAGIDSIVLWADSQHQVTVVEFMGTMKLQPEGAGGFKGLLLPPGAVVAVQGLRISFWGEPASALPIRVVTADQIKIAGKPVEEWMGKPLMSAKTAEVKDLNQIASKSSENFEELPVEIQKSGEISIPDALAQSCKGK